MPEVADIFRRYGPQYLDAFGDAMLPSHRRAFHDILDCRTPAMGGHILCCDHCGQTHYVYHSCRNRHCPKCHAADTQAWLAQRRSELLPVPYFHLVFTVPKELRRIIRSHQKTLYPILMKAAAKALIKLAADPHYVGGQIGVLAVLHTWSRAIAYHPHVHCLVPGGGVSADHRWLPGRDNFLVPVMALSKIFRGMFLDMASRRLPHLRLPASLRQREWVVHCKRTIQGTDRVLEYLARYVYRTAITNARILSIDDGKVTFRYQRSGQTEWKTTTLPAKEFIRRFLQHVLPKGVHKLRYYGLWAPSNRPLLRRVQAALLTEAWPPPTDAPGILPDSTVPGQPARPSSGWASQPCPYCHQGTLLHVGYLPRQRRAPP